MANSFTYRWTGLARTLDVAVGVAPAYDPNAPGPYPSFKGYKAIWDTGATGSVVSRKVVEELGLVQTGFAKIFHAQGCEDKVPTYFVNIVLPNKHAFHAVRVSRGDLAGADVLIGMDIITMGDFAVTNHGGKTIMSFRSPSCEHIDFRTPPPEQSNKQYPGTSRNSLCPCGSGKKYKRCHGA